MPGGGMGGMYSEEPEVESLKFKVKSSISIRPGSESFRAFLFSKPQPAIPQNHYFLKVLTSMTRWRSTMLVSSARPTTRSPAPHHHHTALPRTSAAQGSADVVP